jgi:hypothetical protein
MFGRHDKEHFSVDRANEPGTRNDDANTVLYDLKPEAQHENEANVLGVASVGCGFPLRNGSTASTEQ